MHVPVTCEFSANETNKKAKKLLAQQCMYMYPVVYAQHMFQQTEELKRLKKTFDIVHPCVTTCKANTYEVLRNIQ